MAYKVLIGIDYPPDRRAEPDDVVDDIPKASVKWLIEQGIVEETTAKVTNKPGKPVAAPVVEPDAPAAEMEASD